MSGILFDLGVSSLQLDRDDRGFSYSQRRPARHADGCHDRARPRPTSSPPTPRSELKRIFYAYGDEKLAPRYASKIVQRRAESPITTSAELVEVIIAATPAAAQRAGHPAKRVFQALRIEVNHELAVLERAIPAALDSLEVGGRIVVLSYQSLEDRIVKRELQARAASTAPAGLPVELPEHRPELRLLVRGAELATDDGDRGEPAIRTRAPARRRAAARTRSWGPRHEHRDRHPPGGARSRAADRSDPCSRPARFRGALRSAPMREQHPRHVEIVTTRAQRRARPTVVHAVVTLGALFVIFAAQLLLSIAVSDGAYQIADLQPTQKELSRTEDALAEQLSALSSPQNLVANAASLGMVIATDAQYLRLADGAVLAAPPVEIRDGCATMCAMVGNALTKGLTLVKPTVAGTAQTPATQTPATGTTTTPTPQAGQTPVVPTTPTGPTTEPLPAPVTQ